LRYWWRTLSVSSSYFCRSVS